jgi:hypothetical protein
VRGAVAQEPITAAVAAEQPASPDLHVDRQMQLIVVRLEHQLRAALLRHLLELLLPEVLVPGVLHTILKAAAVAVAGMEQVARHMAAVQEDHLIQMQQLLRL